MPQTRQIFIPGLHFFCDHRCWRCPLADRCLVPVRMAERPASRSSGPLSSGPAARVAAVVMTSLSVTMEQIGFVAAAASRSPGASDPLAEPDLTSAYDPDAASKAAEADPLTMKAREYALGSLRVIQTLRPRLMRYGDTASIDAADRLEETCITVASKIHRALSSALSAEDGLAGLQTDSNGSAKVALLLIEESRQAWRTLMRPGHAVGNGAPAGFVETLNALEASLHARFPRALEFVRPGFDSADTASRTLH